MTKEAAISQEASTSYAQSFATSDTSYYLTSMPTGATSTQAVASSYVKSITATSYISFSTTSYYTIPTPNSVSIWNVVTIAGGNATTAGNSNGVGVNARFNFPEAIATNRPGFIFVADTGNNLLRQIDTALNVMTISTATYILSSPRGIAIAVNNSLIASDSGNNRILRTTVNGASSIIAGVSASFANVRGVAVDSLNNVYVAVFSNHVIKQISNSGTISIYAGQNSISGSTNGDRLSSASFNHPIGIVFDSSDNLFVTEYSGCTIRKISSLTGLVSLIAGTYTICGYKEGQGASANFFNPWAIAVDPYNNLFITDQTNNCIRMVNSTGYTSAISGLCGSANSGYIDGNGNVARYNNPAGITYFNSTLYISDAINNNVRKLTFS